MFNTFLGFDGKDEGDFDVRLKSGNTFLDEPVQEVLGKMQAKESCIIRKGYFPDTVAGLEYENYCLVSLDADLNKPILAGLEYFYPKLVAGGYILSMTLASIHGGMG